MSYNLDKLSPNVLQPEQCFTLALTSSTKFHNCFNVCALPRSTPAARLQQLVQDNEAMLDKLLDAGQNSDKMLEYSQTLEDVGGLLDLIDDGCGYLSSFLDEMIDLFLPGFLCTVAIIFALVVNITFYCSAGCCKAPGAQPKTNVGGNYKGGDKLQNV